MGQANYNNSVFINCPFDTDYENLIRAIVFGIYRCGFYPVTAKLDDNGLDTRISKIERIIENCRFGIHDLSRTELNIHQLPRYNMPFELGIFFGARRYGDQYQKKKNALILDSTPYRYLEFISDLRGVDIRAHNNDDLTAMLLVRKWLKTASKRATIPGETLMSDEYNDFKLRLPEIAKNLGTNSADLPFNDYCSLVEEEITILVNNHNL